MPQGAEFLQNRDSGSGASAGKGCAVPPAAAGPARQLLPQEEEDGRGRGQKVQCS